MAMSINLRDFFERRLWAVDTATLPRPNAFLIRFLRLCYVGLREFSESQITLRAMGLVYPTLLALVPLFAVSFSVLKAFGVHNMLMPLLQRFLSPLGARGDEITGNVIGYVENLNVGVLGGLGLFFLFLTLSSLIKSIEDAFVSIWKLKRKRSLARKFSDFTSVLILGPLLIFSAIGLTAYVMSTAFVQGLLLIEPFGFVIYFGGKIAPYVFVCLAFALVYIFVPSTKVRFKSALVGGVFAGVLWETAGWAFAAFIVKIAKYPTIYSGFAVLMLFIFWLHLSWLILFVGAQVSFYHQYPHFTAVKKEALLLSNRLRERLALVIMFLIGDNHYRRRPGWTLNSLLDRLNLPVEPVQEVLAVLEGKGLIIESGDEPPAYLPAEDIETITLKEVFDSVRVAGEEDYSIEEKFLSVPEVDAVISRLDTAVAGAFSERTIRSLVVPAK